MPGSKPAEGIVRDGQVRWFTVPVSRKDTLEKLVLESSEGSPAPTTVAITADLGERAGNHCVGQPFGAEMVGGNKSIGRGRRQLA